MASRVLPFTSRVRALNAKEMIARDQERARKIVAGMHPHGPRAIQELRRRRSHHHHHHHGGATGGESTGGDDVPSEPGTGSGAEPPVGGTGVDVTDAGVTYTASVGVGNPPSQYTLLIDTGELTL